MVAPKQYKKIKNLKEKYKLKHVIDDFVTPEYYNNSKFDLEINKSTIEKAGLGVFALEYIPPKTYIGRYEGKKITRNKTGFYYFEINNKVGMDAGGSPRGYMAMINDSYNTTNTLNCEFIVDENKQIVEIWSITDIKVGCELFVSYGECYWNDS